MNILISGISCSGKTTLANGLKNKLNTSHIKQDWYFKNKKEIPLIKKGYLYDSPNAFYIEEFTTDIKKYTEGKQVYFPSYDIKNNKRISKDIIIEAKKINLIEGLHTIEYLKDLKDTIKIFVDTPLDECLKRRIQRDKKYNIQEQEIIRYFNEVVIEMYKLYIEKQKNDADYILKGEDDKLCLLKTLQTLY